MCAEDYKTAFSHFNLGVACYYLAEYDEAERVLSLVNYMDPSNAETWAYLALVLLKKEEPPLNAAYQTMNEAVKLGLANGEVMYEIALSWSDLECYKQVLEALENTIRIKAANCKDAELLRLYKQCALKLKGKTETDTETIINVLK